MLNQIYLKEKLEQVLGDYVLINEYQDKYYFVKQLKDFSPEIAEKFFYNALNLTNIELKKPCKKKYFIKIFLSKISLS